MYNQNNLTKKEKGEKRKWESVVENTERESDQDFPAFYKMVCDAVWEPQDSSSGHFLGSTSFLRLVGQAGFSESPQAS